jgi:hypothetical protein
MNRRGSVLAGLSTSALAKVRCTGGLRGRSGSGTGPSPRHGLSLPREVELIVVGVVEVALVMAGVTLDGDGCLYIGLSGTYPGINTLQVELGMLLPD